MEEIQEQDVIQEPVSDNSESAPSQEGQAQDAPSELILGKFKSVEDLTKAYEKLERHQGLQSEELGKLRQNTAALEKIQQVWKQKADIENEKKELQAAAQKYNTPEYFQDSAFREIYKEAYLALGKNLDSEKLINLLEGYVESRIYALEKNRSAQNETEKVVNSMTFSQNNTSSIIPPKKRLDEMTPKEVDELLERLI